jgi:endonuclease-3
VLFRSAIHKKEKETEIETVRKAKEKAKTSASTSVPASTAAKKEKKPASKSPSASSKPESKSPSASSKPASKSPSASSKPASKAPSASSKPASKSSSASTQTFVSLSELPPFPVSKKPDNRANFNAIWGILSRLYPKPEIELDFETPFELLAATILSAQCTDVQVNAVTKTLFKKYKTIEDYAHANPSVFEKEIFSTGFYRMKTKHVIECANIILSDYGGQVPQTMAELTKLPGVGRKTANIVLARGFGIIEGIAVDTHVKRLSNKLGFTENEDPEKIEKDLMKLAKKEDYDDLSLSIIFHGRRVCNAQRPKCGLCQIRELCPSAGV